MVINDVFKKYTNKGKTPQLFFYRDRSQYEVDLLCQRGWEYEAYEIKSSTTFTKSYLDGIAYLKTMLKDRLIRSAVVYAGKQEFEHEENGIIYYRNFMS